MAEPSKDPAPVVNEDEEVEAAPAAIGDETMKTEETTEAAGGEEMDVEDKGDDAEAAETPEEEHATTYHPGRPRYQRGGGRGYRGGRNSRRHVPYRHHHQDSDGTERNRRVYVGNLSWDVSWRELKDYMKTTGCEVTRADVMTTPDGRSKGCGIVEFATEDGARRAVLTLNDTDFMGRQIFVREDREEGPANYADRAPKGPVGGRGFASSEDAQSRRVYVGNLSWDVAWQDLKDHMRQAGDVAYAEVMTEPDGRSKGCGIVEYNSPAEAQEAITSLTDTELKGRMIFVREDRETTSGNTSGRQSTSVFVGNLAFDCSWQDLKDHMRQAGNVDQANILTDDKGRSKGCATVVYQSPQGAQRAMRELQHSVLHGRPIYIREDREQGGGGGGSGAGGCQLFVSNLSYDTTWRELKDHFRQCGDVERAEVMETPDGRRKGFGTVRFYRPRDASNAIRRLNGVELMGRRLEVRIDHKAE